MVCSTVRGQSWGGYTLYGGPIPEGSFKWESVARSSAVSSNGGLRKGGRVSLPSLISLPVVFMVNSWNMVLQGNRKYVTGVANLAALVNEDKFYGIIVAPGD